MALDAGTRTGASPDIESQPELARRTLSGGVLLFRWVAFLWMAGLNLGRVEPFRHPALAWLGVAAAGGWTLLLTLNRRRGRAIPGALWIDLGLSTALIVLSGVVMPRGSVTGRSLFYATAYPLSTALSWGAARGLAGALAATVPLTVALAASRPVNGIPLGDFDRQQVMALINGVVGLLLAGGAAGVVSNHLDRTAVQLRFAIDDAIRSRERAARLAEHESMARAIHDSVLQALAMIQKRGRELAADSSIPAQPVLELAEMAGAQERALRAIIVREPPEAHEGMSSLRAALERGAEGITHPQVTISAVGPIWLPTEFVEQLAAAVRQALDNVVEHAGATRAAVFADHEDGLLTVSIRDDGCGFVYDEEQLRTQGKAGLLKSMRGRVQELGGRMRVESAPGAGTEIQLIVPTLEAGR